MPGVIFGTLFDRKPIVDCVLVNPTPGPDGEKKWLRCRALIDTGATDLGIRSEHIQTLGLAETEAPASVSMAVRSEVLRIYTVDVVLVGRMVANIDKDFTYFCTNARAIESNPGSEQYQILLGMNCLMGMDLTFSRDGWFKLYLP